MSAARGRPRVLAHEHGTRSKYVTDKCRCDECKAANAAYTKERYRTFPVDASRLIRKYAAEYDQETTDAIIFGTKVCAKCGRELPDCTTYFTANKGRCKRCRSECSIELYAARQVQP